MSVFEMEFFEHISDLVDNPDVLHMRNVPHHSDDASCYDHSLYVSYVSFVLCKRLKLNARAAARGGLLHDLHLNEFKDGRLKLWKRFLWLSQHPKLALKNAVDRFDLTKCEQDIIRKHMWPISILSTPRYVESLIVNAVDTYCAAVEFLGLYHRTKARRVIDPLLVV